MNSPLNTKTMVALVREHLLTKGSITNVEAQAIYRCRALPKRISELKADGMPIDAVWKKDSMNQRYVRYELNTEAL